MRILPKGSPTWVRWVVVLLVGVPALGIFIRLAAAHPVAGIIVAAVLAVLWNKGYITWT